MTDLVDESIRSAQLRRELGVEAMYFGQRQSYAAVGMAAPAAVRCRTWQDRVRTWTLGGALNARWAG